MIPGYDRIFSKSIVSKLPTIIKCSKDVKYKCFYCHIEFTCEGGLAIHLTTLQHIGLPDTKFRKNPQFMCMLCGSDIPVSNVVKHQCVEKAFKNYWELVRFIDEFGSPNMCLLCRGLVFETPAHLNTHLLISHNWLDFDRKNKKKQINIGRSKPKINLRCPICLSKFSTSDKLVLHRHLFEDHVPEIGISMLNGLSGFSRAKYGSANDLKQFISKRIYSCFFPNFRVKRYPINSYKHINRIQPEFTSKMCTETFSSLLHLSSHLCAYHFVDVIAKAPVTDVNVPTNQLREEQDQRLFYMQQEIDLHKRSLIGKGVILDSIPAERYCLECFKLYDTNFELQVNFLFMHIYYLKF